MTGRSALLLAAAALGAAVLFLASVMLTPGASADTEMRPRVFVCAPYERLAADLERFESKRVIWRGVVNTGRDILELWHAEDGSWSTVVHMVEGMGCILDRGDASVGVIPDPGEPA